MGVFGRLKRLFQSGSSEESFETYMESANERLREFAVAMSRAESGLVSAKERLRSVEKQAASCRQQAEHAAQRQDAETARLFLERELVNKNLLASMLKDVSQLEASVMATKERYMRFKTIVEEAGAKRDLLLMRQAGAAAEWEVNKVISGQQLNAEFERQKNEAVLAEARLEAAEISRGDYLDREIEKLHRNKTD
ncbi:PspA/IM30 family protein [Paenibacillus humicola]|uniref:PspA/IM30 family protein n=1 Tax=Paenibacillus humicola TaxID=3110540 RepID=UPI00237B5C62|nr:hypothetical protein [Paenibacillus humicola]